jgi:hypothetical protein
MDNDNEIISQENPVDYFLDGIGIKGSSEKAEYSLEEHFKASGKNRNLRVYFLLALLALSLFLVSWAVTEFIGRRDAIDYFGLNEFKDVDFMDILNEVQKTENELSAEENSLASLRAEYISVQREVSRKAEHELKLLLSGDMGESDRTKEQEDIYIRKDEELRAVDERFLPSLSEKEEKIALLQGRLSAFDSEKVRQAREYEKSLADSTQRFNLEKERIISEYDQRQKDMEQGYRNRIREMEIFQDQLEEALNKAGAGDLERMRKLYNPLIPEGDGELSDLVRAPMDESVSGVDLPEDACSWVDRGYVSEGELLSLKESVGQWSALMGFLKAVPYENDVPPILGQLEYRYALTINRLLEKESESLGRVSRSEDRLAEMQSRVDSMVPRSYKDFHEWMSFSLSQRLKDTGGQGFMMEPGRKGELMAFMDPFLEIPDECAGYIYGADNEYGGEIELKKAGLFFNVAIVQMDGAKKVKAFDRIYLKENIDR